MKSKPGRRLQPGPKAPQNMFSLSSLGSVFQRGSSMEGRLTKAIMAPFIMMRSGRFSRGVFHTFGAISGAGVHSVRTFPGASTMVRSSPFFPRVPAKVMGAPFVPEALKVTCSR